MLETLISFVTIMLALSVASERMVELVKGFSADLSGKKVDAKVERERQLKLHWLSLVTSALAVLMLHDYIASSLHLGTLKWWHAIAFTVLASGGSSSWNSVVSYLLSLKTLKQQDATAKEKAGNADLRKALPATMPTQL